LNLIADENVQSQFSHLNIENVLQRKCRERLDMGGPRKRKDQSQGKKGHQSKTTKSNNQSSNQSTTPSSSDEGSEEDDHNIDNELSLVNKNVTECRVALEQVLVTFKQFQERIDILEKRVMEVQLNRSESLGAREAFIPRKGNPCLNEKDSLFKEAFESTVCKLRVLVSCFDVF
jgi:hypothetical protein